MTALVERLQGLAFARAPLPEANDAIARVREERAAGGQAALSYEVALPALDPDTYLTHRLLPRLVYFLDCRGASLLGGEGLFVSLFSAQGLHFIEAGAVLRALGEARGLDPAELRRRYGEGGVGDPPLLGS